MLTQNRAWALIGVLLALGVAPGCTNNSLDDGDGPDVVLEVLQIQTNPVTGEAEVGSCSVTTSIECLSNDNCPGTEACILPIGGAECTVTQWTMQLVNVPKNPLAATSPYNDILLRQMDVVYREPVPPYAVIFSRTKPLGGTVPADGTASLTFEPITFNDLVLDNTTLDMYALIRGETVSGDGVQAEWGAQLFIENCLP